jgi:polysaccharide pyruvyl transferase WcaK-like protein
VSRKLGNKKTTLLLGSYGRGNIGDDAFLLAALELLPDHKLYINSANDNLLSPEVRLLVTTIATGSLRDFLKKIKVFRDIRNVIYCGGDLWVELYGDRMPRKSLYKMTALNIIARLTGKDVYYIGCGIGKLSGYSLWLARFSARLANGVLAREQRSADALHMSHVQVGPDLTVNLPYFQPPKARTRTKSNEGKFVVGISILYFVPNPASNFPRLVDSIAKLVASMPPSEFRFVLLPMLISSQITQDDLWASEQLRNRLGRRDVDIIVSSSVKECVASLAGLDLLVGARLHANILATLSGTPCLGIAYRPKVSSFFHDNDLDEYCIDLDGLDKLEEKFWQIYDARVQVSQKFLAVSRENLKERSTYQVFISQHF